MDDFLKDLGAVSQEETTTQAVVEAVEQPTVQVEQPTTEVQQTEVLSLNDDSQAAVQTTDTQTVTSPTEIDRGAILNELFGVNDPEAIKAKLSDYDRLQQESEKPKYQSKFAEYIDNLVAKYGDPKSQADVFKKTIDVLTTDVDSLDEKTALAFQMKQEYPSLTDGEIDTLINGKYNLNDYATEEQQKIGAVQLKLDSQKAKLSIKQMQADAFKDVPSKANELRQIDEQKRVLDWKPKSQDVAKAITSFEFEVDKGKKMKFDIPEADKAMLAELAESVAVGSGWLPDNKSVAQVQEIVKMTYAYNNMNKLISNAYKKGVSQTNAEWATKVHNPSGIRNTAGGVDFEGSKQMDVADMIDKIMSGK
jgi:hypothetical protein